LLAPCAATACCRAHEIAPPPGPKAHARRQPEGNLAVGAGRNGGSEIAPHVRPGDLQERAVRGPKDRHTECAAPLALVVVRPSFPGLTAPPTHCRPFGPHGLGCAGRNNPSWCDGPPNCPSSRHPWAFPPLRLARPESQSTFSAYQGPGIGRTVTIGRSEENHDSDQRGRRRLTCNCANERARAALTEATSSSESLSRRRASAR
jgi:hypothetical protein